MAIVRTKESIKNGEGNYFSVDKKYNDKWKTYLKNKYFDTGKITDGSSTFYDANNNVIIEFTVENPKESDSSNEHWAASKKCVNVLIFASEASYEEYENDSVRQFLFANSASYNQQNNISETITIKNINGLKLSDIV